MFSSVDGAGAAGVAGAVFRVAVVGD